MNDITSRVEQMAARAAALYSRPTVALEIVRLTNEPQVDPRQLKQLLEQDPALTSKILRVVNSSFFSLRREVADLNQALALLGNKPLRLLVLGFSLPDKLFTDVAAEQLQWYWRIALTRAVAARQLAVELWREAGDEAFIAGLMQDIGVLALLRELGQPYAELLSHVIHEHSDLAALERDTLGFDHVELSAALMRQWNLPERLVEAVATPKLVSRLAHTISVDGDLARMLHLADLMAQLVGQRRFGVLPELLEAGGAYRDLTKGRLGVLVEKLQPQVEQLASMMAVELDGHENYVEVLATAHERMSTLAEEFAGEFRQHRSEDEVYTQLLGEAQELTRAMQAFLESKQQADTLAEATPQWTHWHAPHAAEAREEPAAPATDEAVGVVALLKQLAAAVPLCRARRQELSLILFETNCPTALATADKDATVLLRQSIDHACRVFSATGAVLPITSIQLAAILPNCERRQAVALANEVLSDMGTLVESVGAASTVHTATVSIGLATVAAVPKNFDPWRVVESAERCLYAARSCNTHAVKSIEM